MPAEMDDAEREERRMVLRSFVIGAGVACVALAGFALPEAKSALLRPPGAIDEDAFLAACIKCGQCVQVCPVEAIRLLDADAGFAIGTPVINARDQACDFSCDAVQCVLACPTEALTHRLSTKEQVRMGVAKLVQPDACLARHGLGFKGQARGDAHVGLHRYAAIDRWNPVRIASHPYDLPLCDLCVRECPIKGAIALQPLSDDPADPRRTPVIDKTCVGCGMCEMICPAEPVAIAIEARRDGRGV